MSRRRKLNIIHKMIQYSYTKDWYNERTTCGKIVHYDQCDYAWMRVNCLRCLVSKIK